MDYRNPGSLQPFGDFQPQGFLSGMMFPDKVRDYRTMTDLSNQTSRLANQRSAAELEDYKLGGELRSMQRIRDTGEARNAIALQPDQHRLNTQNLMGDLEAGKYQNEFKVWSAQQQLPQAQRAQNIQRIMDTATMLKTLPPEAPLENKLQILQSRGVDVSRWQGRNPQQIAQELEYLQNLDPEVFKAFNEMELEKFKQTQMTGRHLEQLESNNRNADVTAGRSSAAGKKQEYIEKMDNEIRPILRKHFNGEKLSADEEAALAIWQVSRRDPFFQAGAKAQGEGDATSQAMGALRPEQNTPPPRTLPQTDSQSAKTITLPNGQELQILFEEGGKKRVRDPATGKTGWYEE